MAFPSFCSGSYARSNLLLLATKKGVALAYAELAQVLGREAVLHPFIPFLQSIEGVDDGLHGSFEQSGQLATNA